jgi:5'-nucleotidase
MEKGGDRVNDRTNPATEKLLILHTNDLHSAFEQMPKIASAFRERGEIHCDSHILKLDIGDHMDRVRTETEGSVGAVNVDIMNATGYEYVVLGNNEGLTFTPQLLRQMYAGRAQFQILGSNIEERATGSIPDWLIPHAIVEKGPLRIGLIGVTARYNDFYELLGWHVTDPEEVVASLAEKLRPEVDLLIVMSHLGLGKDQHMAQTIAGIDCILGGHTHHLLEQPLVINDTYICAAGKLGYQIGELECQFTRDDDGTYRLCEISGRTIAVAPFSEDEHVLALWREGLRVSRRQLRETVTVLEKPLKNDWYRESELGNLLVRAIRRWTNSEIGIVNAGQLLRSLDAGAVSRLDLLEICPSPINPCRMRMRGRDIRKALEQSLLKEYQRKEFTGFGFRGKVLGALCVDGLQIEYDRRRPPNQQISSIVCNGEPFADEREYEVGTIDMFTFGIGYLSLKEGNNRHYYLPEFIRDLLADALTDDKALTIARQRRWKRL